MKLSYLYNRNLLTGMSKYLYWEESGLWHFGHSGEGNLLPLGNAIWHHRTSLTLGHYQNQCWLLLMRCYGIYLKLISCSRYQALWYNWILHMKNHSYISQGPYVLTWPLPGVWRTSLEVTGTACETEWSLAETITIKVKMWRSNWNNAVLTKWPLADNNSNNCSENKYIYFDWYFAQLYLLQPN